jgi:hypothetical protein
MVKGRWIKMSYPTEDIPGSIVREGVYKLTVKQSRGFSWEVRVQNALLSLKIPFSGNPLDPFLWKHFIGGGVDIKTDKKDLECKFTNYRVYPCHVINDVLPRFRDNDKEKIVITNNKDRWTPEARNILYQKNVKLWDIKNLKHYYRSPSFISIYNFIRNNVTHTINLYKFSDNNSIFVFSSGLKPGKRFVSKVKTYGKTAFSKLKSIIRSGDPKPYNVDVIGKTQYDGGTNRHSQAKLFLEDEISDLTPSCERCSKHHSCQVPEDQKLKCLRKRAYLFFNVKGYDDLFSRELPFHLKKYRKGIIILIENSFWKQLKEDKSKCQNTESNAKYAGDTFSQTTLKTEYARDAKIS